MSGNPTLLSIDQGTTSSRAILFSAGSDILSSAQKELPQQYPYKGWVEQDAEDIWNDTIKICREVVAKAPEQAKQCAGIGITNQRETTIIWNRKTGKPVYNAVVWQDRRTSDFCARLSEAGHDRMVTEKTGLLIDPYFSCSKIRWILENVEGKRALAERGELAFGTVDCFLLWRLTGGAVHATDVTNASRTGLYNIVTQEWDDELLALYDVPRALLPEVKDNAAHFGDTLPEFFGRSIPVLGMAGDQHAALIGQCCFEPGMMKSTYGTGCFALMNIGGDFKISKNRLLTTPAYRLGGKMTYAVEGSVFIAGAAVQWLRDNLQMISSAAESESLAVSVKDNNGVFFIPAFTGLGAPHWVPEARAAIVGLTRESTKAHIVRAALEAQAYQTADLLGAMRGDSGVLPATVRADGGLVSNGFVCQFLADILQSFIEIPKVTETTALGAAYLAGLQAGIYNDLEDLKKGWQGARVYKPKMKASEAAALYEGWRKNLTAFLSAA
ncbi:MAG: glycerol kinase GlpK [Alphaproteobacteria bacterium]